MLRVQLVGNLGADPEKKYTQSGSIVVSIRVAAQNKPPQGQEDRKPTWFRVTAFGTRDGDETWQTQRMELLNKGDSVFISGQLDIGEFERQDGSRGVSYDVRFIDQLYKIDWGRNREQTDEDEAPRQQERRQPAASGARRGANVEAADDSDLADLPF